jgi:two-component system sensor histidine kinase VanS
MSVRLKLTLSYAGFLMVAGPAARPCVVFLLRYVPARDRDRRGFVPGARPIRAFAQGRLGAAVPVVLRPVGGWFLAGWLAPLRASQRPAGRERVALNRIELEGRNDEFRELADSFDAMLARLEAQVAEQRRFAANASHELRTPLAITQTLLEVAREDPNRHDDELIERLRVVNAARSTSPRRCSCSAVPTSAPSPERTSTCHSSRQAAETLLPLAEQRGVTIETSGDVARTLGSHALLLQMTTNLLTMPSSTTSPRTAPCTCGPPWAPDRLAHGREHRREAQSATRRHTHRTVPTRQRTHPRRPRRVGLGLAIVKSITQAHDGALTIVGLPEGGIRVTAEFPVAQSPTAR